MHVLFSTPEFSHSLGRKRTRAAHNGMSALGLSVVCRRPYTVSGFSSIWQRKMKSALVEGVLKERFTDHDLRRKTASDLDDLEHAKKLLGHANVGTAVKHYRVKPEVVEPGR